MTSKLLHLLPIDAAEARMGAEGFVCPCCSNSFAFPVQTRAEGYGACPRCSIEHSYVEWGLHSAYPGARLMARLVLAMKNLT